MDSKTELRRKLRDKIHDSRMGRSSKKKQEKTIDHGLSSVGLDFEKLKADLEAVKKAGGLTLDLKKNLE